MGHSVPHCTVPRRGRPKATVVLHPKIQTPQNILSLPQVTIVEKADSSSVLPSPLSISTKSKMTFLFANLKDRDFLVQRISDFLQKTPSKQLGGNTGGAKASIADPGPEVRKEQKGQIQMKSLQTPSSALP